MGKATATGRNIRRDKRAILEMIRREESYIKVLYTALMEDITEIGRKAKRNQGMTIVSDLRGYADELKELIIDFDNEKVKGDIVALIGRIEVFISQYRNEIGTSTLNRQMKVNAILSFIVDALNKTLLPHLKQTYASFRELEEMFRVAA